MLPSQIR